MYINKYKQSKTLKTWQLDSSCTESPYRSRKSINWRGLQKEIQLELTGKK